LSNTQNLPLELKQRRGGVGGILSARYSSESHHEDKSAESWEVFLQASDVSFTGPHALCIELFYF
jgi:hypothetical protein